MTPVKVLYCSKCGVELVSEQVPRLIMAPVWPLPAGRLRTCQSFMRLGVRRATDSYRISRHLQAAAQTISKTITLLTAAQCALPRSLA